MLSCSKLIVCISLSLSMDLKSNLKSNSLHSFFSDMTHTSVMQLNWRMVAVMSIIGDVLAIRKFVLSLIALIIFVMDGTHSFMS